ncbi:hypothetical protein IEQ34_001201 [Dendrobium chrysotoxum]|uniref:Uncharacterized protein n=1 Tax=Dendrobium chrysotoxum TaxID=161865 RepID=A0AAV7HPV3_DENCH|nr:hypothetical protein IEQ34_001201 [Dendrobium chrysotoxum]
MQSHGKFLCKLKQHEYANQLKHMFHIVCLFKYHVYVSNRKIYMKVNNLCSLISFLYASLKGVKRTDERKELEEGKNTKERRRRSEEKKRYSISKSLALVLGLESEFVVSGCPLKVDNATSVSSQPSLTCVLVELDITKNYLKKLWLGVDKFGYIQSVQIEALPPFCDLCKVIGHAGAVENAVVNGNVGDVYSNPLCHVKSFNEVLNFVGNRVEVDGAVDHSIDVGLVGPSLVIFDGGYPVVLMVLEADALVALVDVLDHLKQAVNEIEVPLSITLPEASSCGNYEDGFDDCDAPSCGINKDVVDICELNPCLLNLVTSPIVSPDSNVDISYGEIEFSDDSVPLDLGDHECDPYTGGILTLNCCEGASVSLPKGDDPMAKNFGVVDVPISVLSNDALLAHLTCNVRDYEVMHGD